MKSVQLRLQSASPASRGRMGYARFVLGQSDEPSISNSNEEAVHALSSPELSIVRGQTETSKKVSKKHQWWLLRQTSMHLLHITGTHSQHSVILAYSLHFAILLLSQHRQPFFCNFQRSHSGKRNKISKSKYTFATNNESKCLKSMPMFVGGNPSVS